MRISAKKYVVLLWLILVIAIPTTSEALPLAVTRDLPGLSAQGKGTMRFLGFKVYDVCLWTVAKPYNVGEAFALELIYAMSFKGSDIAARSIKEMRGQGYRDEAKLKTWGEEMARIFPDVKPGDTLVGVNVPGKEARFYSQDKFIAVVPDPEFAKTFFDIWLSEKTSEPEVLIRLLGPPVK